MDYIYSRIDNNLVDINKIKDLVLKTCEEDNVPFEGLVVGDKYLELTVVDSDDIIYCSLADLQNDLQNAIDDLGDELQAEIEGKQDTLIPGENIIIKEGVISAEIPDDVLFLDLYLDDGRVKVNLEDWMTNAEEINKTVTMNINGYSFLCKLYKSITSEGGELNIYLETENIRMQCNGDPTYSENWTINLSEYFPLIDDNSDFAPYLEISKGKVIDDNVINPQWVTDFNDRADVLKFAPAKSWVRIDEKLEPCTIYSAHDEDTDEYIVYIQTSKGEYKLTYQWETDLK